MKNTIEKKQLRGVCLGLTLIACGGLFSFLGCATPTSQPVNPHELGVVTEEMDFKDYELAATAIAQEMFKRRLPKGFVVALGPVETRNTPYSVDVKMLQERLAAILDQEGSLRFTSLVNAMEGNSAASEIFKTIEFNYWKDHPLDEEDVKKFGKIANVNGLLFGRVSSLERGLPKGGREVTYTFSWKFTDTRTGVDEIRLIYDIRKNVPNP